MHVSFLTKEDNIHTDADIAARTGAHEIASLWQVHGNRTIIVREPTERKEQADGLITDKPDLLLTIRAADCQQILVYAPEQRVVGLLHVGWRGLLSSPIDHMPPPPHPLPRRPGEGEFPSPAYGGGVRGGGQNTAIQAFFCILEREWNILPQETFVAVGPSLRQCCAEYREPDHPLRQFPGRFWNSNTVDLAGIADMQLAELGLPNDHIERHPDCTCCHPEKYWTYRGGDREKVLGGYTNVMAVMLD